jgi:drug/metabolite transporter (DMT)-like permease
MVETLFAFFYLLVCFLSAYINIQIQNNLCPLWISGAASFLFVLCSMGLLKYSKLSLATQSNLITVFISIGYFIALTYFGSEITKNQWIGMVLVVIGAMLMNK